MKYESIREWRDLEDRHLYHTGDAFPYDEREVSAERIADLSGNANKAGFALIKAVPDAAEEIHTQTEEKPKKVVKSRKKTV